ncbi:MAG: arylsulfotransferase family protein, partial [Candidatus Altiarchaeota archaeon]
NIMVFDNGRHRCYSRVIELNPITREIVWEYTGTPRESFFTDVVGRAQPLPNGNVLVTEGMKGHVFEITRDKEVVWDYWLPYYDEEGNRYSIYRMRRYPADKLGWLNHTQS